PRRTQTAATMRTRIVAAMPPGVTRSGAFLIGDCFRFHSGWSRPAEVEWRQGESSHGRTRLRTVLAPRPFPGTAPVLRSQDRLRTASFFARYRVARTLLAAQPIEPGSCT